MKIGLLKVLLPFTVAIGLTSSAFAADMCSQIGGQWADSIRNCNAGGCATGPVKATITVLSGQMTMALNISPGLSVGTCQNNTFVLTANTGTFPHNVYTGQITPDGKQLSMKYTGFYGGGDITLKPSK